MVGNDLQLDQSKPDSHKSDKDKRDKRAKAAPAATPHTTLATGQQKNVPRGTYVRWCPLCQNNNHMGYQCKTYKTPEERRDRFVQARLCFYCAKVIGDAHQIKECPNKEACQIKNPEDGSPCGRTHHPLLHTYLLKHKTIYPSPRPGEPQPQQYQQRSGSGPTPNNQESGNQGNGEPVNHGTREPVNQ